MDKKRRASVEWVTESHRTYGSIVYQLQEVHEEAASCRDFIWQTLKILAGTAWVTGILVAMFILTALMCYFGIAYLTKCPMERNIPIYLLVGGAVGMVKVVMLIVKQRQIRQEDLDGIAEDTAAPGEDFRGAPDEGYTSTSTQVAEALVSVFLLCWFVCGNYWVFKVYKPPYSQTNRSPTPLRFCDKHVYHFALAQITICHSVIGLMLFTMLIILCCAARLQPLEWV